MEKFYVITSKLGRAEMATRNSSETEMTHPVPVQEELPNARNVNPEENVRAVSTGPIMPCHLLSPIYEEAGFEIPTSPDYTPQAEERPALDLINQLPRQAAEHEGYQSVEELEAHLRTVSSSASNTGAQYTSASNLGEQSSHDSSLGVLSTGTGEQPTGSGFGEPSIPSTRVPIIISATSTTAMNQMMKVIDKIEDFSSPEKSDN